MHNQAALPIKAMILGPDSPANGDGCPSGLIDIEGKALLERQIDALETAGIMEIVIVGGEGCSAFTSILARYPSVRQVFNPFSRLAGPLGALWVAHDELDGSVLLLEGGVVPSTEAVEAMMSSDAPIAVAGSTRDADVAGDVIVEDGFISDMTKALDDRKADARSVGLIALQGRGVGMVHDSLLGILARTAPLSMGLTAIVGEFIGRLPIGLVVLDDLGWLDIGSIPWQIASEPSAASIELLRATLAS